MLCDLLYQIYGSVFIQNNNITALSTKIGLFNLFNNFKLVKFKVLKF